MKYILGLLLLLNVAYAQVNVFLGTSGDHGQLSPAASYPFSMLDISPQTYPNLHAGYERKAKVFLGFTHGRLQGVGCMGSGGNLLIKPFVNGPDQPLLKKTEQGSPGFYALTFTNGIACKFTLQQNSGIEAYHFPAGKHGFYLDLAHALANGFKAEQHSVNHDALSGWIESGTTCRMGTYRVYYALSFDQPVSFTDSTAHTLTCFSNRPDVTIRIAFSSVSAEAAKAAIGRQSFGKIKSKAQVAWQQELSAIRVSGDPAEKRLFESLLYRCLQAPFKVGPHRYSGWTIWDNYKTTLPLLSLIAPARYQDMVTSLAEVYKTGKQNWATNHEPANTVRTEHALVVLLDAYRKGYRVDLAGIKDSLVAEGRRLDFSKPDKALESSYDCWALGQILTILQDPQAKTWLDQAANWKTYWDRDFKDLTRPDIDRLSARNLYQGTIWQYRWFVPFDQQGLMAACGGESHYLKQLDAFFAGDYYNAANEPDIQVPYLYNGTSQPWKSQDLIRRYARDTVIQYYSDDNYRGINPQIGRVYNNRPDAFLLSMDDDMGAMSAWYILAAIGLSPACVGTPVYYLSVPLFKTVTIGKLSIVVRGKGRYILSVTYRGQPLDRNWITQQEIQKGGTLTIRASNRPNTHFGIGHPFQTALNQSPQLIHIK